MGLLRSRIRLHTLWTTFCLHFLCNGLLARAGQSDFRHVGEGRKVYSDYYLLNLTGDL